MYTWAVNSVSKQPAARINVCMARKMPYTFKKDAVASRKSIKRHI